MIKLLRFIWGQWPQKKTRYEYVKSIFDNDVEAVCNVDISQNEKKELEIEGVKHYCDEKDLNNFPS